MKSPEAMASGRGVINLRFNQDQGLLRCWKCCMLHDIVLSNKSTAAWLNLKIVVRDFFTLRKL